MKKIIIISFFIALSFMNPLFADLEVPGEVNPLLSEKAFSIGKNSYVAKKMFENGSVTLKIETKDGKPFWSHPSLGEQEKLFIIDSLASSLSIKDLDGDLTPEIIVAARIGPNQSALYVFKFDKIEKKFVPMNFKHEKENLIRKFMVSDMYQKTGQDLVFVSDNEVRALGKIYKKDLSSVAGFYFFKLTDQDFISSKIIPVPSD